MPDSFNLISFKNISVETAKPDILPLVKRFFQKNGMRAQAARNDDIIIARDTDKPGSPIIAALRLCPLDDNWLLRSMCVDNSYQRQGIGQFILNQLRDSLFEKQCFCFAYTHLEEFYHKAGFSLIPIDQVPASIAERFRQYAQTREIVLMQYNAKNADSSN